MSAAHTTTAPSPLASGSDGRRRLLLWTTVGAALATLLAIVAIAVWPASEADKARDDGVAFGTAVAALADADTADEVDAALDDLAVATGDTVSHADAALADQVSDQADALARAAEGFVGVHTSDDAFSVDFYQAELNAAVEDLEDQAADFREQGPEVRTAFWEGVDEGLEA